MPSCCPGSENPRSSSLRLARTSGLLSGCAESCGSTHLVDSSLGRVAQRRVEINPDRRLVYMPLIFEGYNCREPGADLEGETQGNAYHSISTMSIRDCRIRVMRGGSGSPMLF